MIADVSVEVPAAEQAQPVKQEDKTQPEPLDTAEVKAEKVTLDTESKSDSEETPTAAVADGASQESDQTESVAADARR